LNGRWDQNLNSCEEAGVKSGGGEFMATIVSDQAATAIEKRVVRTKRMFWVVVAIYAYELTILTGFWAAGYVPVRLLLTLVALVGISMAACGLVLYVGRGFRRNDLYIHVCQTTVGLLLAFGVMLAAPQICIVSLATLVAIIAFGFLAPSRTVLLATWATTIIGIAIVIAFVGPRLTLPTDTPAGRFLCWCVMLGSLTRCMWIVNFVRDLKQQIREKNTALNAAIARIELLVNKDELTGLDNRRSLMQQLPDQLALHDRTGLPLCVALIDLDHFKHINDTFGHGIGDRVLQIFAREALFATRSADRLWRYGGEEFVLVLPATGSNEAGTPLERIRRCIADLDWLEIDSEIRTTIQPSATT
jgi:diguanylate cyclase (GGDEF)-like protein